MDLVLNGLTEEGQPVHLLWSERTGELYIIARGDDREAVVEVYGRTATLAQARDLAAQCPSDARGTVLVAAARS